MRFNSVLLLSFGPPLSLEISLGLIISSIQEFKQFTSRLSKMETNNEKLSIEELPEEIIEKILSYLNVKSLKTAALTCERWNRISAEMRWELKLKFEDKNEIEEEPWIETLLESNRNFKSIQCEGFIEKRNVRLMDIFEKHGGNVQKLVMVDCEFDNFQIFCDVLNFMPNLKEVTFRYSDTRGRFVNNFSEDHLPHLPKLETLKLVVSDLELIKYFKNTKLNSFEIFDDNMKRRQEDVIILLDFLTHQKNLKCLKLEYISSSFFSEFFETIATENFPYKLKELSLSPFYIWRTFNHSNFSNFLEFHSDTVEKLRLRKNLPDLIVRFSFSKFKRLAALTFFDDLILRFPNDLSRLEINPNIKILNIPRLKLIGVKEDALKEFLKHVPNVEMLRTSGSINLHVVSNALTCLTHLELCEMFPYLDQMKSQSLRSITIDWLIFIPDWKKFAASNPNVKKMKIKYAHGNFNIVRFLTNMKLQHLELPKIKVDVNVCKALHENTQDMKSLSIHKASFVNCQENLSDVKCLRFHDDYEIYDDDKIWYDI
ncbi:CLUMA_CG006089, isoform A [Clunio marinus]|uniref:CLUMA_CG006089, isoform A n=1 Tax=Clunio marinus TaxID=568069 RepID=A0A1J1HYB3_9DIPT|nr:CLUMA_CG006089, isoform A [Clunio marinus]